MQLSCPVRIYEIGCRKNTNKYVWGTKSIRRCSMSLQLYMIGHWPWRWYRTLYGIIMMIYYPCQAIWRVLTSLFPGRIEFIVWKIAVLWEMVTSTIMQTYSIWYSMIFSVEACMLNCCLCVVNILYWGM